MGLGPAEYRVLVQYRGGTLDFYEATAWLSLDWSRVVDDISSGSVTLPVTEADRQDGSLLGRTRAWQHELALHRKEPGGTFEEVWVGPIVEIAWASATVKLSARDLTQWWERRRLPRDRSFVNVDLGTIFATLHEDAMHADTSPNLTVSPHVTGIVGTRTVLAAARRRAADELRELARTGVDYTVIGRNVIIGGQEVPVARLPVLTDAAMDLGFDGGGLTEAGLFTGTEVTVVGSVAQDQNNPNAEVPVATVGGVSAELGLIQREFSEGSIEDAGSAQAAAFTRWQMVKTTPLFLDGRLRAAGAPPFRQLIPGAVALAQLQSGARTIDQDVRLADLRVSATAGDGGVTEQVSASFIPVGSVDGDITITPPALDAGTFVPPPPGPSGPTGPGGGHHIGPGPGL